MQNTTRALAPKAWATALANQRLWVIAERPRGRALRDSDFQMQDAPVVAPEAGQVVVRTRYLAFAPAQKSWMENLAGYRDPVEIGSVMPGPGAGVVVQSRHPDFEPGDVVYGELGWRECPTVDGAGLSKVPDGVDPTAALSVMHSTGRTAYLALTRVGKPRPGDTLVVSGAAGAVGSLVGQIGRIAGCRVIGITGGPTKCAWLTEEVGFDAAVDYKSQKVRARLRELCPGGIDVFFDNVGGQVLDDSLTRLAPGARVVICGGISRYNHDPRGGEMPPGPRNYFNVVATGATIQGFLMPHHESAYPEADARLVAWLREGRIKPHADIQTGFENAPATLRRLFEGLNVGKQLLRLDDV